MKQLLTLSVLTMLLISGNFDAKSQVIIPDQTYYSSTNVSWWGTGGQVFTCGITGYIYQINIYMRYITNNCSNTDSINITVGLLDATINQFLGYSDAIPIYNSYPGGAGVSMSFTFTDGTPITLIQGHQYFISFNNLSYSCPPQSYMDENNQIIDARAFQVVNPGSYSGGDVATGTGVNFDGIDANFSTYMAGIPGGLVESACNSYTSPSGNYTWIESGTYTDTVQSVFGYDSVIVVNLSINNSEITQSPAICAGESITVGNNTYTATGDHTDILTSVVTGCDSTVTTHLTVDNIDLTVSANNNVITANQSGATYQWINCNGNTVISNETNQTFTALQDGDYAVQLSAGACSGTSGCSNITVTGITEKVVNNFSIYPNPGNGLFTISSNITTLYLVELYNSTGQLLISKQSNQKTTILDIQTYAAGFYFISLNDGENVITKKIIKN